MSAVYFIDSTGRAITDIPKGGLVQRLSQAVPWRGSQRNEAMPVTYLTSDSPDALFFVSDGIEMTANYLQPLLALEAWQRGEVFRAEEEKCTP